MDLRKLTARFVAPFQPPFYGLAAVFWVYFVASFILHPQSLLLRGDFPDTDDYTYLTQTLDWLRGQSWFDNVQYRMAPPEGVPIHFSRLAQLPIALFILFFRFVGFPWIGSATLAAIVYSLTLFALLFVVARWVAKDFVPTRWARASAYIVIFSGGLIFQFTPGHIDHHALESVLTLTAFGCVLRMLARPEDIKFALCSALLLSLSLAIALEVLPWVLAFTACVGLWFVFEGKKVAKSALTFGVVLHALSVFFLFVTQKPSSWFVENITAYSIVYVVLTGCIALCFVGVFFAAQTRFVWLRVLTGFSLSGSLAVWFFTRFPELLRGPYGAMDPRLAKLFFSHIGEALPMANSYPITTVVIYVALPLLALGVSLKMLYSARGHDCWRWSLVVLLLSTAVILSVFYQVRVIRYASLFSVIPLLVLLERGWCVVASRYEGRRRFYAEVALLLIVGPLPAVLLPAAVDGRPFNTGVLLYPVHHQGRQCEMSQFERVLASPRWFGKEPLTIMNMIDSGPEILFRTRHKVMAAPYHTNVHGNLEAVEFFSTSDVSIAEEIARRNNINLVLMCRMVSSMYIGKKGVDHVRMGADGKVEILPDATFTERLMYHRPPLWLQEISIPNEHKFVLYKVVWPKKDFGDK